MAEELDPRVVFNKAYQDRQAHPLRLPGNPYKLAEARLKLDMDLSTARDALDHERHPATWRVWDSACSGLSDSPREWTEWMLRHRVAFSLGYDALPGLEVMGNPELSARFTYKVVNDILPAATAGLALPPGEPMMLHLVDVLESTLALIDEALTACEVADA